MAAPAARQSAAHSASSAGVIGSRAWSALPRRAPLGATAIATSGGTASLDHAGLGPGDRRFARARSPGERRVDRGAEALHDLVDLARAC